MGIATTLDIWYRADLYMSQSQHLTLRERGETYVACWHRYCKNGKRHRREKEDGARVHYVNAC
jgi:hypothetical protein